MRISLAELAAHLDSTFEVARFNDYAPNGLQVEGVAEVSRVVCGVSANQALIDAAVEAGAQALIVHHGFFWRNESRAVVGVRAQRLLSLLASGVSLFAYHLPLDAHPTLGNNAQLLAAVGVTESEPFGAVGRRGVLPVVSLGDAIAALEAVMGPAKHRFCYGPESVRSVAVVTGAGAGDFDAAIGAGVDMFISGEASEMAQALAREAGVHFLAFGHHNTERFGPKAVAIHLRDEYGLDAHFIDIPNPV
jgi:dinuclear metal center YbgI/SA1388 family protein